MTDAPHCRLYLITPSRITEAFIDPLKAAVDAGDVACLQLRLKTGEPTTEETAPADEFRRAADLILPVIENYDIALILNDRADLVTELGADGVHVGQDDMPYDQARATVGTDRIVGVTCHNSQHLAMIAGEAGADYVAFGAFYPTQTKTAKAQATLDTLAWWQSLFEPPCVAIGGITVDNAEPLIRHGADFLAVSSGVWKHAEGPARAVKEFNRLCDTVEFDPATFNELIAAQSKESE